MDDPPKPSRKPPELTAGRYLSAERADRYTPVNPLLQTEARPVFDIANAGPRQRFVVLGNGGPFIVHNCVQALARCIIADQMLEISKKYRIVTMSHDEIVVVCPERQAQKCLDYMIETMSTPPDWASGLPLAAEGGFDTMYSK